jgi:hypothetical protein
MDNNALAGGVILIVIGMVILINAFSKQGTFDFIKPPHWWSLLIVVISGVMSWVSMVWILDPKINPITDIKLVDKSQLVSLGFSCLISVVWWASYIFLVAKETKENDN